MPLPAACEGRGQARTPCCAVCPLLIFFPPANAACGAAILMIHGGSPSLLFGNVRVGVSVTLRRLFFIFRYLYSTRLSYYSQPVMSAHQLFYILRDLLDVDRQFDCFISFRDLPCLGSSTNFFTRARARCTLHDHLTCFIPPPGTCPRMRLHLRLRRTQSVSSQRMVELSDGCPCHCRAVLAVWTGASCCVSRHGGTMSSVMPFTRSRARATLACHVTPPLLMTHFQ